MDRIKQLEDFLREDPDDPFNQYALALEYLKQNTTRSYQLFQHLMDTKPAYLPTYYPFAHLLVELKDPAKAESVFRAGIEAARSQSDAKTQRELQSAYNDWLFERGE